MVAWLAVLNDILVFILGACMSLLLSLRSKGGGSLIASSSWSGFKGRLNPIHQKERNVQQLIQWNLFKRHIFTSLWNPFDQVQLLIKLFSNFFFFGTFWKSNIYTGFMVLIPRWNLLKRRRPVLEVLFGTASSSVVTFLFLESSSSSESLAVAYGWRIKD